MIQDENVKQTPLNHTPITGGPYRTHHLWTTASVLLYLLTAFFGAYHLLTFLLCSFRFVFVSGCGHPPPSYSVFISSSFMPQDWRWSMWDAISALHPVMNPQCCWILVSAEYSPASRQIIGLFYCVYTLEATFSSFCGNKCEVFCSNNLIQGLIEDLLYKGQKNWVYWSGLMLIKCNSSFSCVALKPHSFNLWLLPSTKTRLKCI